MDFQEFIPDAMQAPSFNSSGVALSLELTASYWLIQQMRQLEDLSQKWIFSQIAFFFPQRHHIIIFTVWEVVSPVLLLITFGRFILRYTQIIP